MNDIISINYNEEQPTVLGRDLHEALEVATPYDKWFPRMCEYGFEEEKDYSTFLSDRSLRSSYYPCRNDKQQAGQGSQKKYEVSQRYNATRSILCEKLPDQAFAT